MEEQGLSGACSEQRCTKDGDPETVPALGLSPCILSLSRTLLYTNYLMNSSLILLARKMCLEAKGKAMAYIYPGSLTRDIRKPEVPMWVSCSSTSRGKKKNEVGSDFPLPTLRGSNHSVHISQLKKLQLKNKNKNN